MLKWITLVVMLAVLFGCVSNQSNTIDLTVSNNGQTIETKENMTLVVTLESNMTTGYKWNLVTAPDDKVVKFVASEYVAPESKALGAGSVEKWKFQTTGRGTTTVKLAYFRPFDPKDVAKEFSFTVTVK